MAKGYVGAAVDRIRRGSTVDLAMAPMDSRDAAQRRLRRAGRRARSTSAPASTASIPSATPPSGRFGRGRANRDLLVDAMKAAASATIRGEWWHFTLTDEPFPKQRFDFPVR